MFYDITSRELNTAGVFPVKRDDGWYLNGKKLNLVRDRYVSEEELFAAGYPEIRECPDDWVNISLAQYGPSPRRGLFGHSD